MKNRTYWESHSALYRVPLEILDEFISLAAQNNVFNGSGMDLPTLRLSHVCRSWRTACLQNRTNWSNIVYNLRTFTVAHKPRRTDGPCQVIRLYLARSRGCPLRLELCRLEILHETVYDVFLEPRDASVVSALADHSNQWDSAKLHASVAIYLQNEFPGINFPVLRSLALQNPIPALANLTIFQNVPHLSDLDVGTMPITYFRAPLASLRYLRVAEMLEANHSSVPALCPNLLSLTTGTARLSGSIGNGFSSQFILSDLRNLRMTSLRDKPEWINVVTAPKLASLQFSAHSNADWSSRSFTQLIANSSGCRIQFFTIQSMNIDAPDLRDALTLMPFLRHLTVSECTAPPRTSKGITELFCPFDKPLFSAMIFSPENDNPLVPRLEVLCISGYSLQGRYSVLVPMIESRTTKFGPKINKKYSALRDIQLQLRLWCMSEEEIDKLRAVKDNGSKVEVFQPSNPPVFDWNANGCHRVLCRVL